MDVQRKIITFKVILLPRPRTVSRTATLKTACIRKLITIIQYTLVLDDSMIKLIVKPISE